MLKYRKRTDTIFVFTLDPILGADIRQRLADDNRTDDCKVILPHDGQPPITDEDFKPLWEETTGGRLIILDVRRHTLPRVQQSYNRIMGYNRADLNERVFSLAVGDGPAQLFTPGTTFEVFRPLLAKTRLDYGPAVFFFDPFIHYSHEEMVESGFARRDALPTQIPRRLTGAFDEKDADVNKVRQYFRAAGVEKAGRAGSKRRRQEKLVHLFEKRLRKMCGEEAGQCAAILSRQGLVLKDETLRMIAYPLHFEDWVVDLLTQARTKT
jgi:hypothetical protein